MGKRVKLPQEEYLETVILKLDKIEMELDTMKSGIYKNMQKTMSIEEKISGMKKL
ncbi:MAG: hypothetical protein JW946_00075 [Candidatus Omnitrophica bacterium]|nr:hypothetical protein [Candidatus Omnitrophota bacterium]